MEDDEPGYVVVSTKTEIIQPFGEIVDSFSYSWKGGKQCSISMSLLREGHPEIVITSADPQLGDMIRIGPYRIVITNIEVFRDCVGGRRVDSQLEYIIQSGWIRLRNWLYMIYKIVLFTGVVWKLVDYDPAVQISWRDFKLFKMIKRPK